MSRPVFKRTLEVKPVTFYNMLQVLEQREEGKRKTGRPANLTLKDQLVPPLLFWREYRTYHHMALDWEVDESCWTRRGPQGERRRRGSDGRRRNASGRSRGRPRLWPARTRGASRPSRSRCCQR